jgi:hypothetical protein
MPVNFVARIQAMLDLTTQNHLETFLRDVMPIVRDGVRRSELLIEGVNAPVEWNMTEVCCTTGITCACVSELSICARCRACQTASTNHGHWTICSLDGEFVNDDSANDGLLTSMKTRQQIL